MLNSNERLNLAVVTNLRPSKSVMSVDDNAKDGGPGEVVFTMSLCMPRL